MSFILNEKNKNDYDVINDIFISEIGIEVVEIIHKITKCKIVLMINDDENRAFNISFKTYPYSDNGICHIMEHSVLCGSRKYDVKDPFFIMAKSSLATFLNAMTGIDMTYYPISSANEKDFKNLMDVYLDAVFYPNIYKNDNILREEGWHYEIDNKEDELKINGVVLNEMKGANSVPSDCIHTYIRKDLFDGTVYQYNFGGVTKDIINITQDEFINFHKIYYSPSNAYIYLYGKLDMNERLEYMQNEYLSKFNHVDIKHIKLDIDKIKCVNTTHYYDSDDMDINKSYIAYSLIYNDDKDNLKHVVTSIVNYILFNKEGSLVKDELVKKGFGENINVICEEGIKNGYVSIICENIDANKKEEFINEFNLIIQKIINNGIDKNILQATLNSAYLNCAEGDPTPYTKGLMYIFSSLDSYSNGYGVDNFIKYQDAFDLLYKEDLSSNDNIFIKRIKELYVEPKNKCVTVLSPKKGVIKEEETEIKSILDKRKTEMVKANSSYSIDDAINDYNKYKEFLSAEDDRNNIEKMPKLSISDIDRDVKLLNYDIDSIRDVKVLKTIDSTGDLVYIGIDFYLPLKNEEFLDEDKYILSIALNLLGSLDTKNYTYDELDTMIDMYTGGIDFSVVINDKKPIIRVNSKIKIENLDKAYNLINEVLFHTKFLDADRIKQKLMEMKISSNDIISSYVNIASVQRAASSVSYTCNLSDKMVQGGIAYDMFINDFIKLYDEDADNINKALYDVLHKYIRIDKMMFDCCMNADKYDIYENNTKKYIEDINNEVNNVKLNNINVKEIFNAKEYDKKDKSEVFVTNSNVNFVSRAIAFDKNIYNGKLKVLNNIIDFDYLHKKIRVEGGAYGSRVNISENGYMIFFSYSDPNFIKTDEVYNATKDFVKNLDISSDDVQSNVIGSIKRIDTYPTAYKKHLRNISYYLKGQNNDMINTLRHEVLDTKKDDFKDFVDLFDLCNSDFCAMITANNQDIAKEEYINVKKLKK